MGVKYLWSVLTPHAERKPISELRGKVVAIDLAGWVCESLNVVDYFIHPRHHLKNLFFRTCYLIWEEVTPIFVLEGVAPKLKSQIIEKRNEIQFRGVKPKNTQSHLSSQNLKCDKNRTRFNHVLKQCEILLQAMGIQCVQGPGEAEAYCAFLNLKGLVDGVISQDSDCFAYGAIRVYRNFSISTQGSLAAQGGAVDIYDMNNICSKIDFGQNKVIAMALLCGSDYCPEGVGGVGRDSVLKLFTKYKNQEILERLRSWRYEDDKYSTLEVRVDDKNICSNCGHFGRTQNHTKNGCGVCRTNSGCDETLWREQRLLIKAELILRKKALSDPAFPSEEIILEFLKQPEEVPKLQLHWRQPNVVKFIKQIGPLLQWPEIYCFQKFFPIVTRWQVTNVARLKNLSSDSNYVTPKEIIKKRLVKGIPSLQILWQDECGFFNGLIPDEQLKEYLENNPKGLQDIWTTVEPFEKVKNAYPSLVETFTKLTEKPKKLPKTKSKLCEKRPPCSLENMSDLIEISNGIAKSLKPKGNIVKKCKSKQGQQKIDRFFQHKIYKGGQKTSKTRPQQCSTPITKSIPSDLESDIDEDIFNISDLINGIVNRSLKSFTLKSHKGKQLCYETTEDISILCETKPIASTKNRSVDDFVLPNEKRSLPNTLCKFAQNEAKRISLDDSFDVLVKMGNNINYHQLKENNSISNLINAFKEQRSNSANISPSRCDDINTGNEKNISYFFNNSFQMEEDAFERFMDVSTTVKSNKNAFDNGYLYTSD